MENELVELTIFRAFAHRNLPPSLKILASDTAEKSINFQAKSGGYATTDDDSEQVHRRYKYMPVSTEYKPWKMPREALSAISLLMRLLCFPFPVVVAMYVRNQIYLTLVSVYSATVCIVDV